MLNELLNERKKTKKNNQATDQPLTNQPPDPVVDRLVNFQHDFRSLIYLREITLFWKSSQIFFN